MSWTRLLDTYTSFNVFERTLVAADLHQFHRTTFVGHETDDFTDEIAHEFYSFALFLRGEREREGQMPMRMAWPLPT